MRISEISREVREFYHQPTRTRRTKADWLREQLKFDFELDDDELELFINYLSELQAIGVNVQDERLLEALNAHPYKMEAAIQAVLEYADRLRLKHQAFRDRYHATNCLVKALQDGWTPDST